MSVPTVPMKRCYYPQCGCKKQFNNLYANLWSKNRAGDLESLLYIMLSKIIYIMIVELICNN